MCDAFHGKSLRVFLFCGFLLSFGLWIAGCASRLSSGNLSSREELFTLGPLGEDSESKAFGKALKAEPGSGALEQARIDYLLERVSQSPYNFIRNNDRYTGERAKAHMRWKHLRNLFKVKTAEDFIQYVATQSKMSGEPYRVAFPGRRRYPLAPILYKELKGFDERVAKERQRLMEASEAEAKARAEAEAKAQAEQAAKADAETPTPEKADEKAPA